MIASTTPQEMWWSAMTIAIQDVLGRRRSDQRKSMTTWNRLLTSTTVRYPTNRRPPPPSIVAYRSAANSRPRPLLRGCRGRQCPHLIEVQQKRRRFSPVTHRSLDGPIRAVRRSIYIGAVINPTPAASFVRRCMSRRNQGAGGRCHYGTESAPRTANSSTRVVSPLSSTGPISVNSRLVTRETVDST